MEGVLGSGAKDYTVPSISVNGINADGGQAYGVGFAQGDFIQHNYHWRDVLTHVRGTHTLKFGYEGWYGDDVEPFQGPWSQPKFAFDNLLKLAQDAPTNENGVMYNPATGTAAVVELGCGVQDLRLVRRRHLEGEKESDPDVGPALRRQRQSVVEERGNGVRQLLSRNGRHKPAADCQRLCESRRHNALLHSVDNLWSPRVGVAWDPTGKGDWAVKRRLRHLQQLADFGQRAGGVPRKSARTGPARILRGHQ